MVISRSINPENIVEGYDEYIASISYGKDSLAMLDVIWLCGYPLTKIITVDVMATPEMSANFEEVEEFKKKADKIIFERYGIQVEHLKSNVSYEEEFYRKRGNGKRTKPENVGKIYGFPMTMGAWCNRSLKMQAINKYKKPNQFWYVGYALDEKKEERQEKIRNCKDLRLYPLVRENDRTDVSGTVQGNRFVKSYIYNFSKGWLLVLSQSVFGSIKVIEKKTS